MMLQPAMIKERIYTSGGSLRYVPLDTGYPYAIPATDIRFIKLDKTIVDKVDFIFAPGKKVSQIASEHRADLAFNFPFFWQGLVLGDNKDKDAVISAAYSEQLNRHEFGFKDGRFVIGQLQDTPGFDFMVQAGPLLRENNNPCWDWYRTQEHIPDDIGKSVAQRTFVGTDATGNLLLAVADGRTQWDQGLTLEQMELYMRDKGAVDALNGDGGSSSTLYFSGAVQNQNSGSDERVVHHAVLIWFKTIARDVQSDDPYAPAIQYVLDNKLMELDDAGNFNTDVPVTKKMLAQVLYNKFHT